MLTLEKLPAPLQELLAGVPAIKALQAVQLLTSMKDMKVSDIPVDTFSRLLNILNVDAPGQAINVLTAHMATTPHLSLSEWFPLATEAKVFEAAFVKQNDGVLMHRCYFCGQPNEINLSAA